MIEIKSLVESKKMHIFAVTETWGIAKIDSSQVCLSFAFHFPLSSMLHAFSNNYFFSPSLYSFNDQKKLAPLYCSVILILHY